MNSEIEQLRAQLSEVTRERDAYKQESEDRESDSALIRKLAENVGIDVAGNTHCVPGLVDITEELTTRLAASETDRERLRAALGGVIDLQMREENDSLPQLTEDEKRSVWFNAGKAWGASLPEAALAPALAPEGEA